MFSFDTQVVWTSVSFECCIEGFNLTLLAHVVSYYMDIATYDTQTVHDSEPSLTNIPVAGTIDELCASMSFILTPSFHFYF